MAESDVMVGTFKVYIGGNEVALPLQVDFPPDMIQTADIRSAPTGQDILGRNVVGRSHQVKIRLQEPTVAALRTALNIATGNDPLAVGAQLPTTTLKIRPFSDADDARAFFYPEVSFHWESGPLDGGPGNYAYTLVATAHRDANGNCWRWATGSAT